MRRRHVTGADRHRTGNDRRDAQVVDRATGPHYIGYRIHSADLVEMNLVDSNAVHSGLGKRQPSKHRLGVATNRLIQRRPRQHSPDVQPGSRRNVVRQHRND
jgi:hypothetical protein